MTATKKEAKKKVKKVVEAVKAEVKKAVKKKAKEVAKKVKTAIAGKIKEKIVKKRGRKPVMMETKKLKVERAPKAEAHVDNVKGENIRHARSTAHFPMTQDAIRMRRVRYANRVHEKARQAKSQVAIQMGRLKFADPVKTFEKVFDPADLTSAVASHRHRLARRRSSFAPKNPAMNEVEINIRGGGGSDVVKGPVGKVRGLE